MRPKWCGAAVLAAEEYWLGLTDGPPYSHSDAAFSFVADGLEPLRLGGPARRCRGMRRVWQAEEAPLEEKAAVSRSTSGGPWGQKVNRQHS